MTMIRKIQVCAALYHLERTTGEKRRTAPTIVATLAPSARATEPAVALALLQAERAGLVIRRGPLAELTDKGRALVVKCGRAPKNRASARGLPGGAKPVQQLHRMHQRPVPASLQSGAPDIAARRIATLRAICATPGSTAHALGAVVDPAHSAPRSICAAHIETLMMLGLASRERANEARGRMAWHIYPTDAGVAALADIDTGAEAA